MDIDTMKRSWSWSWDLPWFDWKVSRVTLKCDMNLTSTFCNASASLCNTIVQLLTD